jgi:hypothetical protein
VADVLRRALKLGEDSVPDRLTQAMEVSTCIAGEHG